MAIQDFTAGQVLTAAQMDSLQANDYNQTVSTKTVSYTLVAADKGTRVVMNAAGATTITVNTSLFSAGDTLVAKHWCRRLHRYSRHSDRVECWPVGYTAVR